MVTQKTVMEHGMPLTSHMRTEEWQEVDEGVAQLNADEFLFHGPFSRPSVAEITLTNTSQNYTLLYKVRIHLVLRFTTPDDECSISNFR